MTGHLLVLGSLHAADRHALAAAHSDAATRKPSGSGRISSAFIGFLISLPLVTGFDKSLSGFQFAEQCGLDSLDRRHVLDRHRRHQPAAGDADDLMGFLAILSSWSAIQDRVKEYYAMFLLLQVGMLGVFMSLDFFLFYVFWELVLVPMYFIIGIWGGAAEALRRHQVLHLHRGRLGADAAGHPDALLPVPRAVRRLHLRDLEADERSTCRSTCSVGCSGRFFLGFAMKVPMFPFHTWLPDAHVEAPTAGSVILAGVLLKMGTYGFIRFSLPLLPKASIDPFIVQMLAVLSIIGIIYGALVSLMQKDWKKLVAYSSVSHMGFCTLGIFALTPNGLSGSVIQQINHGISTGMLFLIVGVIYERRHTREISEYGGLANVMPGYAVVFAIAMLSSAGLPLLNGFIGEFTILAGRVRSQPDLGGVRSSGRRPRRGVPAVALPAHDARQGDQSEEREPARPELPRVGDLRAADRAVLLDRPVPEAVLRHSGQAGSADCYARPARLLPAAPAATDAGRGSFGAGGDPRSRHRSRGGCAMNEYYTSLDHFVLLPAIMLALFGCAVMLFEFLLSPGEKQRRWLLALAFIGLAFTGRALWMQQVAVNEGCQVRGFPRLAGGGWVLAVVQLDFPCVLGDRTIDLLSISGD